MSDCLRREATAFTALQCLIQGHPSTGTTRWRRPSNVSIRRQCTGKRPHSQDSSVDYAQGRGTARAGAPPPDGYVPLRVPKGSVGCDWRGGRVQRQLRGSPPVPPTAKHRLTGRSPPVQVPVRPATPRSRHQHDPAAPPTPLCTTRHHGAPLRRPTPADAPRQVAPRRRRRPPRKLAERHVTRRQPIREQLPLTPPLDDDDATSGGTGRAGRRVGAVPGDGQLRSAVCRSDEDGNRRP